MKIALFLTNHLRDFNPTIKSSIIRMMKGFDYDLYVATHYTLNRSEAKNYWGSDVHLTEEEIRQKFSGMPLKGLKVTDDADASDRKCVMCKTYPPQFAANTPISHDQGLVATHCTQCKLEGMVLADTDCYVWKYLRNIKYCYDMIKDSQENYDFYIRSRPDLIMLEDIDFNSLVIPPRHIILGFGGTLGAPNDHFMICSDSFVLDRYCDIDSAVKRQLFAHQQVAWVLEECTVYRYYQTARLYRNLRPSTNQFDHLTIVSHDKRSIIPDKSLTEW
jgi:hypothetical protein